MICSGKYFCLLQLLFVSLLTMIKVCDNIPASLLETYFVFFILFSWSLLKASRNPLNLASENTRILKWTKHLTRYVCQNFSKRYPLRFLVVLNRTFWLICGATSTQHLIYSSDDFMHAENTVARINGDFSVSGRFRLFPVQQILFLVHLI